MPTLPLLMLALPDTDPSTLLYVGITHSGC